MKTYIIDFYFTKSEYQDHSSINITIQMKIKIIIVLKSNALAVFHSHWSNFAAMKPLLFLIGSTDQLDAFCGTVSQLFEFWLNASFRPPGKQKTANFCALLWCVCQNLVTKCHDCDVFFVSWGVTRCVFFALFYCCCYFSVAAAALLFFCYYYCCCCCCAAAIFLLLLLLILFFWCCCCC